jgi:hypothetical protein
VLPDSPSRSQSHTRWTARKDRALAELISRTIRKEPGAGSLEILELLRRQLEEELVSPEEQMILPGPSSMGAGISSLPGGEQLPSSPYGVERQPPRKTFWFNVNAELIIYGATEPDALVTIGGRRIRLRPDGTFSYRFALPDGAYDLPAVATAGDQSEARQARLRFSRRTEFRGEVGAHPQDQALRTPHADHVA